MTCYTIKRISCCVEKKRISCQLFEFSYNMLSIHKIDLDLTCIKIHGKTNHLTLNSASNAHLTVGSVHHLTL